jgi:hypothetical protein
MKKVSFLKDSKNHLAGSNMSYWYHFKHSFRNGTLLLWYVITSYIHAIFPWLFKFHAAHGIMRLNQQLIKMPHLKRAYRQIQKEYENE